MQVCAEGTGRIADGTESDASGSDLMALTRREFGLAGFSFALVSCTGPFTDASGKNLILGGGKFRDNDTGEIKHVISVVDLDARSRDMSETTFLPHGIHRKPTDTNSLAVFEKIGPGACEYDLTAREIAEQ